MCITCTQCTSLSPSLPSHIPPYIYPLSSHLSPFHTHSIYVYIHAYAHTHQFGCEGVCVGEEGVSLSPHTQAPGRSHCSGDGSGHILVALQTLNMYRHIYIEYVGLCILYVEKKCQQTSSLSGFCFRMHIHTCTCTCTCTVRVQTFKTNTHFVENIAFKFFKVELARMFLYQHTCMCTPVTCHMVKECTCTWKIICRAH